MSRNALVALSSLLFAACSADLPTAEYPNQPPISFSHAPGGNIVLDQSQPDPDPANPFAIAIGGQSSQIIAQVFTVGIGDKLRQVEVPVGCGGGTLVLEVRDVVGGVPGTTVLAREGFPASGLPPVLGPFVVLNIRPSPTLVPGTQYALVFFNAAAPAGECGMLPGIPGDPYAGGDGYGFDLTTGVWLPFLWNDGVTRKDLPFFTYMK